MNFEHSYLLRRKNISLFYHCLNIKQRKILEIIKTDNSRELLDIIMNSFTTDFIATKENSQSTIFEKLLKLYFFN